VLLIKVVERRSTKVTPLKSRLSMFFLAVLLIQVVQRRSYAPEIKAVIFFLAVLLVKVVQRRSTKVTPLKSRLSPFLLFYSPRLPSVAKVQ
jgi:hypothetical protein